MSAKYGPKVLHQKYIALISRIEAFIKIATNKQMFKCPSCARYAKDLIPSNSKKKGKSWLSVAYHCMLSPWHRRYTCKYVYKHTALKATRWWRFLIPNKEERRRFIPQSISSLFALGSKLSPYNTVWQHSLCALSRHCLGITYNW